MVVLSLVAFVILPYFVWAFTGEDAFLLVSALAGFGVCLMLVAPLIG